MGLTRAGRTVAVAVTATLIAVGGAVAARGLLDRGVRFGDPSLTDTQAHQAATGFATALDDLAARFLVDDPATERLQVLRWDDDVDSAEDRLAEQLDLGPGASAFVRAIATELVRRGPATEPEVAVVVIETRVTEATPLGLDELEADWVRVDIMQDETYANGETSSSATSYGIAVRDGAVVDVRGLDGLLARSERSSASPVVSAFVAAVIEGDERSIERHTASGGVSDREIATLRAWLAAAGETYVAELPAATAGALQVAYVVPERGPLVRFEVTLDGTPRVAWDVIDGR